jgi:hypothetical protein
MWMNGADIEILHQNINQHTCPNVRKAVRLLYALMEATNNQSDGWHSWPKPGRAANKLMDLIRTTGNIWYALHGTISDADLKKAITPIRRLATTEAHQFKFDVDAALAA